MKYTQHIEKVLKRSKGILVFQAGEFDYTGLDTGPYSEVVAGAKEAISPAVFLCSPNTPETFSPIYVSNAGTIEIHKGDQAYELALRLLAGDEEARQELADLIRHLVHVELLNQESEKIRDFIRTPLKKRYGR